MNISATPSLADVRLAALPESRPGADREPVVNGLSAGALRQLPPDAQRAAAGAQFEAILVRQLLGPTVTSLLGSAGGTAATVYGDLMAETIASRLSAGQGLGLGQMLADQLAPRGTDPVKRESISHP